MFRQVLAHLTLLVLTLVLSCVVYPGAVYLLGLTVFRSQAEGSLIRDKADKVVGSALIAQPFSGDEYFWPRPSAASYNGAASGASNWGGNNYLLRDRVAQALGPIVRYRGPAARKGQPVGPDIEAWFQKDHFRGEPGIVAQWAQAHDGAAQNWVKADKLNEEYVNRWRKEHPPEVAQWVKDHPETPEPKAADLAGAFFTWYGKAFPGTFPAAVEKPTADAKTEKRIEPVKDGTPIQGTFFDLWRQEHPEADLEDVPADLVMASGSGLDPFITQAAALYQVDRVAEAWAKKANQDKAKVAGAVEALVREKASAPLFGLVGTPPLVNVLEINLALRDRFAAK
jgi:K+-transporting ATPase ATPase C chain